MKYLQTLSIRVRLLLLVVAVALPFAGIFVWQLASQEQGIREAAYARGRIQANETATRLSALLREREGVMARLAERPLIKALDSKQCDPLVREYVTLHPEFANMVVRDAASLLVCSFLPASSVVGQLGPAQLPWFSEGLRSGKFFAGDAFFGPAAKRWVVPLTHPIRDAEGQVKGMLLMTLDLRRVGEALFKQVPGDVMVAVVDRQHRIALRSAEAEKWVGTLQPEANRKLRQGLREGSFSTRSVDGSRRLVTFATLPDAGWQVLVAVDETAAMAAYRAERSRAIGLGLAVFAFAFWIAWVLAGRIVRPVLGLAQTADRIAQGDRQARASAAGPAEVVVVAHQFNRMLNAQVQAEAMLASLRDEAQTAFARLTVTLEGMSHGVGLIESDMRIRFFSRRARELLELPDTLAASTFDEVVRFQKARGDFGTNADLVDARGRNYVNGGQLVMGSVQPIYTRTTPSGRTLEIRTAALPGGGWVRTYEDITDYVQALAAKTASEQLWRFALEGTGDGVWDINVKTGAVSVTPGWLKLFGYSVAPASTLAGFEGLIHPEDLARLRQAREQHRIKGGTYLSEHRFRCGDGSWKWIYSRGEIVAWDEAGQPLRKIGVHHDISEQKAAQQALADRVQELERWHDVTLDRERRVIELKREINLLLERAGLPPRYASVQDGGEAA